MKIFCEESCPPHIIKKCKFSIEHCPEIINKDIIRRYEQENAELKKQLEEMDLEKLKEEIIEKLPQLKNKTIYIHEWYELQMWEYDTKIKIKTEGTSKKEAIRAFRKKLKEIHPLMIISSHRYLG